MIYGIFEFLCIIYFQFGLVLPFYLEELKWLNYEVDILQTPVKLEEEQSVPVIYMTSKYGQKYQCVLPQVDDEDVSEKEAVSEKVTDIKELLKPMQSGACLLKGKDWWTYEFCFGHYIKQFHIEDGQMIGQVITLGLYESDYDWENETDQDKFKHVKQRYHSQMYTNGTKCDLTGQPRTAEVRVFCEEDAGDYIYRVDEPGTCNYVITVHTSRLCSHPLLKPLPSNKAHAIPCNPLLNEEQYFEYLQKLNEEKTLAEEKRNRWLNNQQERLQVMKNWAKENFLHIDDKEIAKLAETTETKNVNDNIINEVSGTTIEENSVPNTETPSKESVEVAKEEITEKLLQDFDRTIEAEKLLLQEYDKEIEKLKTSLPPEKFASVKSDIQKQFDSILNEAEDELDPALSDEIKDAAFSRLTSTLNMLLEKLDKAEKDVAKATKELKKARSAIAKVDSEEVVGGIETVENEPNKDEAANSNAENLKVVEDENSQSAVLDDDKLHVRIRRLDRKSVDSNGKLHEMDFMQRKRLEEAVKEKLEKAGLDTGGRRIEVKIITAGYYDNEDGKDFHALSDEETSQFQNMIMALLTGQQEAVQEMERHKKLEESYKFIWGKEEEKNED